MNARDVLSEMAELAHGAGFEMRRIPVRERGFGDAPARSGVCQVKGAVWVVLADSDSVEDRIGVLAQALTAHASAWIESRYVPPAVRARLEALRSAS